MTIVEQVKQGTGAPYEAVCRELAVPYSSLMSAPCPASSQCPSRSR